MSATSQSHPVFNAETEYNSPNTSVTDEHLNAYSSEDQARYLYAKYVADISSVNCAQNAL